MSARPSRWWYTKSGQAKIDRNIAAFDDQPGHKVGFKHGWAVCPCHGRTILFAPSWRGVRR